MEYETIFDITKTGIGVLWVVFPSVVWIGLFIALIRFKDRVSPRLPRCCVYAVSSFAVVSSVALCLNLAAEQYSLRERFRKGEYDTVEGIVEEFDPMPKGGHKNESFKVNGVKFEYSDFDISPGFHNAASHGGPIREGLFVRVSHIGDTIVKLEVATKTDK